MENQTEYWWKSPEGKAHEPVQSYLKRLMTEQQFRSDDNLKHMRLYGNQETLGFGLRQYTKPNSSSDSKVTLNVIQSMVDTATAKMTKNQVLPMFLTDGGRWKDQKKAKGLNKFVRGQFHHNKIYEITEEAFRNAGVFGTCGVKIFRDGNDTCVERVFTDEIIVDDTESIYGKPRQMHQYKWIHKDVLKARFPEHASQIDDIEQDILDRPFSMSRNEGMVIVLESWRLPDKKGAEGRHCITASNLTLFDEKWEKECFPFVFLRWAPRLLGFYGQGLAEQLLGLQVEINKLLRTIQVGGHLAYIPRVLIEHGSRVNAGHINNKIGALIKYTGTPPQFMNSSGSIPQELFAHLDRLYQRAFEITGISQLSAQARKPGGLDSGKALRTFNQIESERFLDMAKRWERFHLEIAEHLLDVARDIMEDEGEYKLTVPGKECLEEINLKDIDLSDDRYILQAFPTAALSETPAARLAEVQELAAQGILSPKQSRKLLDFPDVRQETEYDTAALEDIDATIDKMIETGEFLPPEPFQDLVEGAARMQKAYLKVKWMKDVSEEKRDLLRQWIEQAQAQMQPPAPPVLPADPSMVPAGPVEGGGPELPPEALAQLGL